MDMLLEMGFLKEVIQAALKRFAGNFDEALNLLLQDKDQAKVVIASEASVSSTVLMAAVVIAPGPRPPHPRSLPTLPRTAIPVTAIAPPVWLAQPSAPTAATPAAAQQRTVNGNGAVNSVQVPQPTPFLPASQPDASKLQVSISLGP